MVAHLDAISLSATPALELAELQFAVGCIGDDPGCLVLPTPTQTTQARPAREAATRPADAITQLATPAPAREIGPGIDELHQQATAALMQGQLRRAVERYQAAARINQNHAPTWRGLGLAYERLTQRAQAIDAYERYLRLAPTAGDAAAVRGRLAALQGSASDRVD